MEKEKKGTLPKWWTNVIKDLEIATQVARKSFVRSNVVVGAIPDDITGLSIGYLIRLEDSRVGYYSAETTGKNLPVGSHIKGELPEPERVEEEPLIESYIFEVIKENVALIPRMWLNKVIRKIVNGQPITKKEDLKAFPEWVLLPVDKRSDKVLIDILYRVTRYEGMKGLARFNDLH